MQQLAEADKNNDLQTVLKAWLMDGLVLANELENENQLIGLM